MKNVVPIFLIVSLMLGILIVAGISWILGFMTRWGVHHYYIGAVHVLNMLAYSNDRVLKTSVCV